MLQDRLLEVAVRQFGLHGFEGASTRDIASSAGTAMSSITYHFGGKEGLYLACADYISATLHERLDGGFAAIGDPAQLDTVTARDGYLLLVEQMAALMLHPDSASWSSFVVREQQNPTEAFARIWQGAMSGMLDKCSALLRTARPDLSASESRAVSMLVFGQAMVMRVARASVCAALEIEAIGPAEEALLKRLLRQNTLAILTAEID